MSRARRLLVENLYRRMKRQGFRRFLLWLGMAVLVVSIGTGLCLLLALPKAAYTALVLAVLSCLPGFILCPLAADTMAGILRSLDETTTIEAWLEAPPGPARPILEKRTISRLEAPMPPGTEEGKALKGLGKLFIAAFAAMALLELGAFLFLSKPVFVYGGPPQRAGSGLRIDSEDLGPEASHDRAGITETRKAFEERKSEAEGLGVESAGEAAAKRRNGEEEEALSPIPRTEPGGSGAEAAAETQGQSEEQGKVGRERAQEENPGEETAAGDSPMASGAARQQNSERRGKTSYEDGGDTGIPSPLLDYRARFFKMLAERTKKESQASGELSLGELRDYERRYFNSFSLSAGLSPAEDPYAALLKRRWAELRKGIP